MNVTHHYGVRMVLKNISLYVDAGEIVALMGPNGHGKSTLVQIGTGILWPVGGYVKIDGLRRRESESVELEIRRRVAYLPAEPWLPQEKTGRAWVMAVGRLYGVADDRLIDHVERLLDLFDLTEQANSPIVSYSTGQRKKIALCAVIASEAPVLLLDEPFAGGLDPSGIIALKSILQHHAGAKDRTVLFATPVPELVEEVAQRVAIISRGQLAAEGTLDELKRSSGAASLSEAYERIVNPKTISRIARYFEPLESK